jgi:hypothetical protein
MIPNCFLDKGVIVENPVAWLAGAICFWVLIIFPGAFGFRASIPAWKNAFMAHGSVRDF